ncbi:MAG: TRAP transporter large permease [Phycisphaerales bacterium]|nr:MAG: TRAP transporter large permease [Phycisphaerales bacterium]
MTAVLLGTFVFLLVLNVPVAFCMLLASLAALAWAGIHPIIVGLETARAMSTFYSFLAVPFFILAGEIMSRGGLSQRLIDFVMALVGHRRTGLPMVTVLSSQMFGAISGASSATCAAIGSVMIPAMEENGYPRPFATALSACAGTTGALIPPSITLLIYGTIAGVSIEKLFMGGIGPGILVGLGLMLASWLTFRHQKTAIAPKASVHYIAQQGIRAVWALLLAFIIFAGIMGGVFTATEASAVAVVYALLVSFVVHRELRVRELPGLFVRAAKTSAVLSFLIACASLFAWTVSMGKLPQVLTSGLLEFCDVVISAWPAELNPAASAMARRILVLMILNITLLAVGMFMDAGPALLIVVPVLLPISRAIGMGQGLAAVHFGVLVVANLIIGLITPPVGTTLFVASAVGRVRIGQMVPYVLRFMAVMVVIQLLITYVPAFTTWLPGLLKN